MNGMKASRMTAMVAILITFLMLGSPAAILGIDNADSVGIAAAADGDDRLFKLGVVDMTVSTLNPNTYTMVAEGMIIFPLYSFLIQWDQSGENVIGDLAKDWWISPDGLTWEFDLVETAYWVEYDPDTGVLNQGPKVTAEDVKWSVDTLAVEDQSRLNSIWPEGIIAETWTVGDYHFGITITEPFVPMQDSLMTQIIFPKYIWENENFITFDNVPTVSSGAFYYKTNGLPDAGYAELARNPYWHGETSYGWQLHCDEFVMCRYDDSGTCWSALKNGDIDAMIGVEPAVYVADLPGEEYLEGYHQSNGFVYEFNLNQLTDANRKLIGGSLNAGENNQLLLNNSIKTAISMAVDRNDIINDALYGYGEWTNTLVPSQNPMSHSYGQDGHDCIDDPNNPDQNDQPDPLDRDAARNLLWEAGWRYDAAGTYYPDKTATAYKSVCPLYNGSLSDPDRESLSFRFYTLKPVQTWLTIGTKLVDWCSQIGVELNMELKSVNEMNTAWYSADYDLWLWDWVFTPYTEAASGVLVVLTTDAIGTDSDIYMSDPEFDALYEEAIREMDFEARRDILYDMQDIVYLNRGCQALAFREDLYAFNTGRWDDFGDLNNEYYLLPDVWPVWLSMQMNPSDNRAPKIGGIGVANNTVSGVAEVGVPVTFSALGVTDDFENSADLNYTWIWGFGSDVKDIDTTSTPDHTFDQDGVYTVTLVVKETVPADGHADYLSSYMTYQLTVHDMSNNAPHDLEISMSPLDPTAGEVVSFSGSAVDDEDDDLYYTWDFGDGSVLTGEDVEHQFDDDKSYTVTLMVDDHRYGEIGSRPATLDLLVAVGQNQAPSISVKDYGSVSVKATETYSVAASDADPRDSLVFTWNWGDGERSVTTTPSATHSYDYKGTYTITVYADDQTGLSGHNVSDSGVVYVVQTGNSIPVIAEFYVNNNDAFVEQFVTFSASAADGDGDPLTFTFDFDDGTRAIEVKGGTEPMEIVECSVSKSYSEAGTYSVYLDVGDGTANATSVEIVMTIGDNAAPEIIEFSPAPYYDTGVAMMFSVVAADDDGDDLTYAWDWGDGTTSETVVESTSHTFAESGTYTVSVIVDDGKGLGDSAEADVTINAVPYIDPLLSLRTLNVDQMYTFTVSAFDDDMDTLTAMWDFGDGSDYEFGTTVTHTYTTIDTYTRTVYVWDEFVEYRTTHNVSSSAPSVVKDPSVDSPPDVDALEDVSAVVGEELTFLVVATDDNDDVLTYTWDFDDGSGLYVGAPPVTHTYVAEGEYLLTVWVADLSGLPENNVSVTATITIDADQPPVADAGGDRTVEEDHPVSFTGTASTDEFPIPSDGYAWTVNDDDGAHTYDTMEFEYTFVTPGEFTVELIVTDSIGQDSDPDVITVTVLDITPPEVNAGSDQTVHNGTTVVFDGSATDNYDEDMTFEWRFIYDDVLQTLDGETPSFVFDIMSVYTVSLKVEDSSGNYGTDDVRITVADLVDPIADAGEDQTVDAGDTVEFDGSGSSDLDSAISFAWEFVYDGATQTLSGESPTFDFEIAGVYVVTLTVEDEGANTAADTVTITVEAVAVNAAPVADAGDDATIDAGTEHTFDGSGSSDDVLVVNYTWTFTYDGVAKEIWGVSPSFVFDIAGAYIVTLEVTDAESLSDTDTVTITVESAVVANVAPVADAGADQTVTSGDTVTFSGAGSTDSDGTIVSYSWTFSYDDETKTLSGVAPTFVFETTGTYTVTLTVTDNDGDTDTDTVSIVVEAESDGGEEKTFLESYGLPIAAIMILLAVVVIAMLFMKKGRGGKSSGANEPAAPEEPAPPEDQNL